jgi:transcriptional regulator with XRE-family HTH domain
MAISNKLREIRENEGLSVAELARASEVSDKTIRKIETRRLNKARKITKVKTVKGLNKLIDEKYSYEDIYPNE